MFFEEFMNAVDAELLNLLGVTSEDLPDYGYMDAWEAGEDPEEVAMNVIESLQ